MNETTQVSCLICSEEQRKAVWIPYGAYDEHNLKVHQIGKPKDNGVQLYSAHAKLLMHTQQEKIKKFIENECIEYAGGNTYLCHPIEGYNSTTYKIIRNNGQMECNCQWYTKNKLNCSHIGAVYEYLKRRGRIWI